MHQCALLSYWLLRWGTENKAESLTAEPLTAEPLTIEPMTDELIAEPLTYKGLSAEQLRVENLLRSFSLLVSFSDVWKE